MFGYIKKHILLIPSYITVLYFSNKYLLVIKYKLKVYYLKLKIKHCLTFIQNYLILIVIHSELCQIVIKIKKVMFGLLIRIYKKIKLVGTGFKVNTVKNFLTKMLVFKLGFSHFLYLKVYSSITYLCCQYSKIFIISDVVTNMISLSFSIKSFKLTDIYTGKGIFYYNEQLKLKYPKSS
jgi:hypothetical protein